MVADPQVAVCCDVQETPFNLVASESQPLQQAMVDLVRTRDAELTKITDRLPTLMLPDHHDIRRQDLDPRYLRKLFVRGLMRGAEGFRTVAWHTWPGAEESSLAIAGGGIDLCTGQDAGLGSFRLRTWRKRSHPLPRKPDDLRADHHHPAASAQPCACPVFGQGSGAQTSCPIHVLTGLSKYVRVLRKTCRPDMRGREQPPHHIWH